MIITINPAFKEKLKDNSKKIAAVVAGIAITGAVVASTVVMIERFSRTSDGGHDLSI
jgi:hypothetical protein